MAQVKKKKIRNTVLTCIIICLAQVMILFINYRKVDISYPLFYGNGDHMAVFFYAKSFDEFHINIENPMMGGTAGFDMYDYPYSDSLSFLMVKAIGLFTDNPFLIINLFYFLCTFITAVVGFLMLYRHIDNIALSACLGLLYANSYFFQARYSHIWLIPYFFLPVACSLAVDIIDGTLLEENVRIWRRPAFYRALILAFLCAFTGLYYAYFACALFASAMVIRWISSGKIRQNLYPLFLICSTVFGVVLNVIPNVLYWMKNGMNQASEMQVRSMGDSEFYGLKIIQMLLPRSGHRIGKLAALTERYSMNFPLINENMTSAIGFIAVIGFILSIVWLFGRQARKTYSYLMIAVLLIATVGGIGSMISLVADVPVRSYNRMSLIVMFLSLLCFGTALQRLLQNRSWWISAVAAAVVLCVGIFDQTQTVEPVDHSEVDGTEAFIDKVENAAGAESYVFELPYVSWPSGGNYRMFAGYLFSDDLHWSYGAMQGRPEAEWQKETAALPPSEMIKELREKGYDGLYVDKAVYQEQAGEEAFRQLVEELNASLKTEPIVSEDGNLYYWDLQGGGSKAA